MRFRPRVQLHRLLVSLVLLPVVACGDRSPSPSAQQQPAAKAPAPAAPIPTVAAQPTAPPAPSSPLDILRTQRQTRLYYDTTTLPPAVLALSTRPDLTVGDCQQALQHAVDPLVRFNVVLLLGLRLENHQWAGLEVGKAETALEGVLHDPDPWIRTEAAYALGLAKDAQAVPALTQLLQDPAPTVLLHAALALQQINGAFPRLTPAQMTIVQTTLQAMNNGTINEIADQEHGAGATL